MKEIRHKIVHIMILFTCEVQNLAKLKYALIAIRIVINYLWGVITPMDGGRTRKPKKLDIVAVAQIVQMSKLVELDA